MIICDDVRKEVSNKDILIGVFSGSIQTPSYPADLTLSLWIELESDAEEESHWHIRIDTPSGNPPLQIKFDLEMAEKGSSAFAIRGLPLRVERDGDIVVSMKEGDGDWFVAKRKKVLRMPSPSRRPSPALS